MSKAGSEVILKSLLGMEIDIDALPMGPMDERDRGVETVVLAETVMGKGRFRSFGHPDGDEEVRIKDEPQD
jgi:DEAD/DEAH box helicase domain-containing protein